MEPPGGFGKLASLFHLLDEYGDEIEADLLREYRVDLLDFYRGTLSVRRLGVLVRQLSAESSLVRALNDGQPPMKLADHLLADQWVMLDHIRNPKSTVADHPTRAAMEAKKRAAAKQARVIDLKAKFEKRKRTYGLG